MIYCINIYLRLIFNWPGCVNKHGIWGIAIFKWRRSAERLISIHKGTFLENGEINILHFFFYFPAHLCVQGPLLFWSENQVLPSLFYIKQRRERLTYVVTRPRRRPLHFVKSWNFRKFEHKWHKSMKEFQNPLFFNLFFISGNNLSTHGTLFLAVLILKNFGSKVANFCILGHFTCKIPPYSIQIFTLIWQIENYTHTKSFYLILFVLV